MIPDPPIRRFRTKIDARRLEYEARRGRVKNGQIQPAKVSCCGRCKKIATPVRVRIVEPDGHKREEERCEECLHAPPGPPPTEILRWGPRPPA